MNRRRPARPANLELAAVAKPIAPARGHGSSLTDDRMSARIVRVQRTAGTSERRSTCC